MLERRAQWKFLVAEDGSWYWQVARAGKRMRQSDKRFATLAECALDARREGYVTCLDVPDRRDTLHAPITVVVAHESQPASEPAKSK